MTDAQRLARSLENMQKIIETIQALHRIEEEHRIDELRQNAEDQDMVLMKHLEEKMLELLELDKGWSLEKLNEINED